MDNSRFHLIRLIKTNSLKRYQNTRPTVNTGVGLSSGSFLNLTNPRSQGGPTTQSVNTMPNHARKKKILCTKDTLARTSGNTLRCCKKEGGNESNLHEKNRSQKKTKKKNPRHSSKCKTYVFRQNGWRWCRGRCSGAPVILS